MRRRPRGFRRAGAPRGRRGRVRLKDSSVHDEACASMRGAAGDVARAFGEADAVFAETFRMGRHTGVTLEPRVILADFDPSEQRLTVYHSCQAPNMMQDILARHLRLSEHNVRVICKDVGGSFGIKVHVYPDEMAACAL